MIKIIKRKGTQFVFKNIWLKGFTHDIKCIKIIYYNFKIKRKLKNKRGIRRC